MKKAKILKRHTDVRPQDGLYKGKYNEEKRAWYESATLEYIDHFQVKPLPTSDMDLLKQQNADLLEQLAESEKRAKEQSKTTSELVMLLTEKGLCNWIGSVVFHCSINGSVMKMKM